MLEVGHCFLETHLTFYDVSSCISLLGLFMLNLVCRDPALRKSVFERVRRVFPTVLSRKIAQEINEVLLCFHDEQDAAHILSSLKQAANNLQRALFSNKTEPNCGPHIDIAELLKDLKVE